MKAVFIICTPSHFAHAKTFFQSFVKFNTGYNLYLCVFNFADYNVGDYFDSLGLQIIDIETIGITEYKKMRSQYDSFELSCALKPFAASFIFEHYKPEVLFYFDSDILVTNTIVKAEDALLANDILITPHFTQLAEPGREKELEKKNRILTEKNALRSGVFNGGFFGIRHSTTATKFLNWWQLALVDGAYNDISNGLFTDQLWLNIIPLYFTEKLLVLKDQGYNTAYWNLHERTLYYVDGGYVVNNLTPLVFYHFSGFTPGVFNITRYPCAYTLDDRPDLKKLCLEYGQLLLSNNYNLYKQIKNPIDKSIRKGRKINYYLKKLRLTRAN